MFSLCFLLTLASYGFLGVQSNAVFRNSGGADDYGTLDWSGNSDAYPDDNSDFNDDSGKANSMPAVVNNGMSNKPFLAGGIFAFLGVFPMPAPRQRPSDGVPNYQRAEGKDTMEKFNAQLEATLNAFDELEKDVKEDQSKPSKPSKPSKRFLKYN